MGSLGTVNWHVNTWPFCYDGFRVIRLCIWLLMASRKNEKKKKRNETCSLLRQTQERLQVVFCRILLSKTVSEDSFKRRGNGHFLFMDGASENLWPSLMHQKLILKKAAGVFGK